MRVVGQPWAEGARGAGAHPSAFSRLLSEHPSIRASNIEPASGMSNALSSVARSGVEGLRRVSTARADPGASGYHCRAGFVAIAWRRRQGQERRARASNLSAHDMRARECFTIRVTARRMYRSMHKLEHAEIYRECALTSGECADILGPCERAAACSPSQVTHTRTHDNG